jgi:hypothetical protein
VHRVSFSSRKLSKVVLADAAGWIIPAKELMSTMALAGLPGHILPTLDPGPLKKIAGRESQPMPSRLINSSSPGIASASMKETCRRGGGGNRGGNGGRSNEQSGRHRLANFTEEHRDPHRSADSAMVAALVPVINR